MSLPSADDLFRPTAEGEPSPEPLQSVPPASDGPGDSGTAAETEPSATAKRPRSSGRIRHDEKMTIYVTAAELLDIEDARLSLRRDHGLAVDRGRLVREAIALALAEMEREGADSAIVQRLTAS